MPIDIGDAVRDAVGRTTTPAGLTITLLLVPVQLLSTVVSQSRLRTLPPDFPLPALVPEEPGPFALALDDVTILGLQVVVFALTIAAAIVAIRTFHERPEGPLPSTVGENLLRATGHGLVMGFTFGLLVSVGLVALVAPGIFLFVSLFMFLPAIAIEDAGGLGSFSRSWELTSGNRLALVGLGLVVLLVALAVTLLSVLVSGVVATVSMVAADLLGVIVGAAVTAFNLAAITVAFEQLLAVEAMEEAHTDEPEEEDPLADIDDELLP